MQFHCKSVVFGLAPETSEEIQTLLKLQEGSKQRFCLKYILTLIFHQQKY